MTTVLQTQAASRVEPVLLSVVKPLYKAYKTALTIFWRSTNEIIKGGLKMSTSKCVLPRGGGGGGGVGLCVSVSAA